jgi:hypothetical protein
VKRVRNEELYIYLINHLVERSRYIEFKDKPHHWIFLPASDNELVDSNSDITKFTKTF